MIRTKADGIFVAKMKEFQKCSITGEIWQKNRRTKVERKAKAAIEAHVQILGRYIEIVTSRSRNGIVLPSLIHLSHQSHDLARGKGDDPNS